MKKILALVLAFSVAVFLISCQNKTSPDTTKTVFNLAEYKETVSACCSAVDINAVNYGNIAQYQNNYWASMESLSGTVTAERLVSASEEWFVEKEGISFADLDATYQEHTDAYKEIVLIEIEGKEAEEIDALFRTFFTAYIDLHNLVMSPTGSRSDYINRYNEIFSAYTGAQSELAIFLK